MDKLEPTLANLEVAPASGALANSENQHPDLNRLLMRKLPFDIAGQSVLLLIAAALVYRHASAAAFWTWLGLAAAVQGARFVLASTWRRNELHPDPGLVLLTLTSFGTGLAWGALALAPLYVSTNVPVQTMLMWTVAAAVIWFASTQAARALPFAAFAAAAIGLWLMKIPGIGANSPGAWIQPERANLIALALFVAFSALGIVVYAFQRQAENRRLRAEAEVEPLNEDRAMLAMRVTELSSALRDHTIPAEIAPHAAPRDVTLDQDSARIEPQPYSTQASRVIGSIDNMLTMNQMSSGSLPSAKQRISLRTMLEQLLQPHLKQAQDKRLRLRCVLHAGVPLEVIADQGKLEHILTNLISNAINFTLRGEVVLSVRRADEGKNSSLSFEVADTGPGMRAEDLKRVFEPYFQVSARDPVTFAGLGLGLTVAQRLARLLGGEISVESQPGKGTVCLLLLPVDSPSDAAPRVKTTEELSLADAPASGRGATITRLPAANDAFSARGDGFHRRQEPVYASRPER